MRAYTYSYRSSYHAHIVTHVVTHIVTRIVTHIVTHIVTRIVTRIVTHIVTRIVTRIVIHIVTHIVTEGVAFRSHHRLSIVRPLQGRPYMQEGDMQGKRNEDGETVQQCLAAGGCGTQHRRRWMGGKGGHRGRCRCQMQRRRRMQRTNTDTVFACRVFIEKHHWGECGHSFTLNLVLTS